MDFGNVLIKKSNIGQYPERHVNRSKNPNLISDIQNEANIALRDIKQGEELSISDSTKEDF